jgi:hypothetical protein
MNLLERIAGELPQGWCLSVECENGEVVVGLSDWDGDYCDEPFVGSATEQALAALEYAKARGPMGSSHSPTAAK